ncbi:MAG: hypothetical protein MUD14_26760 [Hydrococcus sp. Prado102]|jgi:hypothetical protein|nr:hypothetical protein [Hydrococcus sp. Prado102]
MQNGFDDIERELAFLKLEMQSTTLERFGEVQNINDSDRIVQDLNNLIGLQSLKDEIINLTNLLKVQKLCQKHRFKLESESKQALLNKFSDLYSNRDKTFGNGRLVRNLFEKTIEKQANRLVKLSSLSKEIIMTILPEDIA